MCLKSANNIFNCGWTFDHHVNYKCTQLSREKKDIILLKTFENCKSISLVFGMKNCSFIFLLCINHTFHTNIEYSRLVIIYSPYLSTYKYCRYVILLTAMQSRFKTIFGPLPNKIIDSNNFCFNSFCCSFGTSCQYFINFVCNVVAPKNCTSDDLIHRKNMKLTLIFY